MGVGRANWVLVALATTAAASLACLVAAILARDGQLFGAALAAGLGIAASTAYAALSLRAAERRLAKLSGELTAQSQRLLRLEAAPETAAIPAALAQDLDALTQATGAIAGALDGHDARLAALEGRDAGAVTSQEPAEVPSSAPALPAEAAETGRSAMPHLRTREDFARAASAILQRLGPEAPPPEAALPPASPAADTPPPAWPPADEAIEAELEAGGLEIWLQPIVTLPQRRVRLYAGQPYLPGAPGGAVGPDVILPSVARRQRRGRLDAFVFARGILLARHLARRGRDTALVLAVARDALSNASFVEGAASLLAEDRDAASRLILEIAEAEGLSTTEEDGLARLRDLGTGFALAGARTLDLDWASLARRGVDYVMMEAATVLAPRPHMTTAFLVSGAVRAGVALVATGVDDERTVPDLLDFDVPLARGGAIAPPRPVRADFLREDAPAPAASPAPREAPGGPEAPLSLRDFLRRAG